MIKKKVLVTGGAGFIGSNLVEALLKDDRVSYVRVLDNLETGHMHNIEEFMGRDDFDFMEGDIRDYETCVKACTGMDMVSHQAALGSVPRSIKDPITTNNTNITGSLHIFNAVKECGVGRVVFAASSSTYGDSKNLPKVEHIIGKPLSPYAITKYVMELYADVFADLYDFKYVGLRYFNVFGPKQDPNGAYAAVIPLFVRMLMEGQAPTINGDGSYSRDFTFVGNAVQANIKALFTTNQNALNQIYNVAVGDRTTLVELYQYLKEVAGSDIDPIFGPERVGDIPHSLADISKAKELLEYDPEISIKQGLAIAYKWYKSNNTLVK